MPIIAEYVIASYTVKNVTVINSTKECRCTSAEKLLRLILQSWINIATIARLHRFSNRGVLQKNHIHVCQRHDDSRYRNPCTGSLRHRDFRQYYQPESLTRSSPFWQICCRRLLVIVTNWRKVKSPNAQNSEVKSV